MFGHEAGEQPFFKELFPDFPELLCAILVYFLPLFMFFSFPKVLIFLSFRVSHLALFSILFPPSLLLLDLFLILQPTCFPYNVFANVY